jgi:hypothetical protein
MRRDRFPPMLAAVKCAHDLSRAQLSAAPLGDKSRSVISPDARPRILAAPPLGYQILILTDRETSIQKNVAKYKISVFL